MCVTLARVVLLVLAAATSVAEAGDGAPSPVDVCAAYGPGYKQVPGTGLCIKVSGDVEVDVGTSTGGPQSPRK
jgi:hypothetical protein